MKLAVVGSRDFAKCEMIGPILDKIRVGMPNMEIVSGGADGPDKVAEEWARTHGIPCKVFAADWSEGDNAGIKRNGDIIENSQCMLAFWDGESAGTLDSITRASKRKNYNFVVYLA